MKSISLYDNKLTTCTRSTKLFGLKNSPLYRKKFNTRQIYMYFFFAF